MRLIERLKQRLSGANIMTETRTEQSKWSGGSVRSVEVIVETSEVTSYSARGNVVCEDSTVKAFLSSIEYRQRFSSRTSTGEA